MYEADTFNVRIHPSIRWIQCRASGFVGSIQPTRSQTIGAMASSRMTVLEKPLKRNSTNSRNTRALYLRSILFTFAILLCSMFGGAEQAHCKALYSGDLVAGEFRFVRELRNFGWTNVARTWIDARLKTVSAKDKPRLEEIRASLFEDEGEVEQYKAAIIRLQKKYPGKIRVGLNLIKASFYDVNNLNDDVNSEPDSARRAQLEKERDDKYKNEVVAKLNANIESFQNEISELIKKSSGSKDLEERKNIGEQVSEIRTKLDQWLFNRVLFQRAFAGFFAEGTEKSEQAWQTTVEWAEEFVGDVINVFLQLEGQLILGEALGRIGDVEFAAECLEVLVDVSPSYPPPYPKDVIEFFLNIRLRALIGTLQAFNTAGDPQGSIEAYERVFNASDGDFSMKDAAKIEKLRQISTQVQIEYAAALLAGGETAIAGIELFEKMIDDYEVKQIPSPPIAATNLVMVQGGLSRALDMGASQLPTSFYYHGGFGYADRYLEKKCLETWQYGVQRASVLRKDQNLGRKQANLASKILIQLAYEYSKRGQDIASMWAYWEITHSYARQADKVTLQIAAQNCLATLDPFRSKGKAFQDLYKEAQTIFQRHVTGDVANQIKIKNAGEAESRGDYAKAAESFGQVEKKSKGKKSEYYYLAKASQGRCIFLDRLSAGDPKVAAKAGIELLDKALAEAKAESDTNGQISLLVSKAGILLAESISDYAGAQDVLEPLISTIRSRNEERAEGLRLFCKAVLSSGEQDLAKADTAFKALQRDYKDSYETLEISTEMLAAYYGARLDKDKARTGEIALAAIAHPKADLENQTPLALLFYAKALIWSDQNSKAKAMLKKASDKLGADPSPTEDIEINLLYGKVLLQEKDFATAAKKMRDLQKKYEDLIGNGEDSSATEVYATLGRSLMELYKTNKQSALLEEAVNTYGICMTFVDRLIARTPREDKALRAQLRRSRWIYALQELRIVHAQGLGGLMKKKIANYRIDGVPDDVEAEFKKLER